MDESDEIKIERKSEKKIDSEKSSARPFYSASDPYSNKEITPPTNNETFKRFSMISFDDNINDNPEKKKNGNIFFKRLICFKSFDNKNIIAFINNNSIIIEKDDEKIKLESRNYIIDINNFLLNDIDYIMYSIFDGSFRIYNLDNGETQIIENVFDKKVNISLCTILYENNIYIIGCSESENIKIYNYNNATSSEYYPIENNNETKYYFIKSFYSEKEKKNFIIFSSKSNNENKINSIDFINKTIYNIYNYENYECDYFEINKYNNEEYLFVCYKQDIICYNFHNSEIYNKFKLYDELKFRGLSIYKEFIFLGGYYPNQSHIFKYKILNDKNQEEIQEEIFIYDNLIITDLKIFNDILIIYNRDDETIKKFKIFYE